MCLRSPRRPLPAPRSPPGGCCPRPGAAVPLRNHCVRVMPRGQRERGGRLFLGSRDKRVRLSSFKTRFKCHLHVFHGRGRPFKALRNKQPLLNASPPGKAEGRGGRTRAVRAVGAPERGLRAGPSRRFLWRLRVWGGRCRGAGCMLRDPAGGPAKENKSLTKEGPSSPAPSLGQPAGIRPIISSTSKGPPFSGGRAALL